MKTDTLQLAVQGVYSYTLLSIEYNVFRDKNHQMGMHEFTNLANETRYSIRQKTGHHSLVAKVDIILSLCLIEFCIWIMDPIAVGSENDALVGFKQNRPMVWRV